MNIGGQNQPTNLPPTTNPNESAGTEHSADVDPNQLLLLMPDMQKIAKAHGEHVKTTVQQSQDKIVTDSQAKAQSDFAKSLISQPELPEGSNTALENWASDIANQMLDTATPQTKQQSTGGSLTPPQTGLPAAPNAPAGAQAGTLPGAQVATPAGTPAGTQTTQDPVAVALGGDPALLLTDDPSVTSGPVKALGKMASTIASSQGGKLTQDQVALLTKDAGDLFTATPSTLTDSDKAVLLSFIGQLDEFPVEGDTDAASTSDKSTSSQASSSSTTGSQTAQTRSAKAPDIGDLAMDELGLGDAVQELGQQAISYVQGNDGKLSDSEAEQLQTAAEALISGGAEGDDLKALQNFLKALVTFPKTAAGPADSPLLLTQPGINPEMVKLSQYANAMMMAQNGTLTQSEADMLKGMAEDLMPQLSPEDQAVLKTWVGTLSGVKTTIAPPVQVFTNAMLFKGAAPPSNPFMTPGIMALLAPILSQILQINNDIVKQSSKLKQNMMKMLVSMANEAFNFAMQAGQAAANKLMNEASMNLTLGISSCVQAGMTAVTAGMQQHQTSKFEDEAKQPQIEKKLDAWSKGEIDPPPPPPPKPEESAPQAEKDNYNTKVADNKKILAARQEALNKTRLGPDGNPRTPEQQAKDIEFMSEAKEGKEGNLWHEKFGLGPGEKIPSETFTHQSFSEKSEVQSTAASRMQSSGANTMSQMSTQFGSAANSFITAGFQIENVQNVLEEASANAYKDMITQLMQLITTTIQTASDEMSTAQKNFEAFAQLYQGFASTISSSFYRSS